MKIPDGRCPPKSPNISGKRCLSDSANILELRPPNTTRAATTTRTMR